MTAKQLASTIFGAGPVKCRAGHQPKTDACLQTDTAELVLRLNPKFALLSKLVIKRLAV